MNKIFKMNSCESIIKVSVFRFCIKKNETTICQIFYITCQIFTQTRIKLPIGKIYNHLIKYYLSVNWFNLILFLEKHLEIKIFYFTYLKTFEKDSINNTSYNSITFILTGWNECPHRFATFTNGKLK